MVAYVFFAKVRTVAGAAAALASLAFANPSLANSGAAADVTAPLRAAQAAKASSVGDEEFSRLFASWKSLDSKGSLVNVSKTAAAPATVSTVTAKIAGPTKVSVPSRMPLDAVALTSGFGMRTHPVLGGRRAHKGIDLASPTGTPVYAPADGVVERADWFSSYGLYISLEHGGDIETRFGHLSRLNVAAGQQVKKGDLIGFVGSTGRSTGPHLHYEVRIAGTAVNPVPYMQGDALRGVPQTDLAMGGSK